MARANARASTIDTSEKDYSVYLDKKITPTQTAFYDWLTETVGDISDVESERVVALSAALLNTFQASDWWAEHREEYKPPSEAEQLKQRIAELEAQVGSKSRASNGGAKSRRAAKAAEPEPDDDEPDDDEPEDVPAPVRRGRPPGSKSKAKPAASSRRGRSTAEAAY